MHKYSQIGITCIFGWLLVSMQRMFQKCSALSFTTKCRASLNLKQFLIQINYRKGKLLRITADLSKGSKCNILPLSLLHLQNFHSLYLVFAAGQPLWIQWCHLLLGTSHQCLDQLFYSNTCRPPFVWNCHTMHHDFLKTKKIHKHWSNLIFWTAMLHHALLRVVVTIVNGSLDWKN